MSILDRFRLDDHGPIDILINNVGGRRIATPTVGMPLDDWLSIIDLNLTNTFLCTKLLGGFMTESNVKWAQEHPDIIDTFKAQIPAGEFGQVEDLGPLAVYLSSDAGPPWSSTAAIPCGSDSSETLCLRTLKGLPTGA